MTEVRSGVNPLFLRDEDLKQGIELLFFAERDFVAALDGPLAGHGLGHAHYRALYFIGRKPNLTVTDLLTLLNITKQSLSRVIADLVDRDVVTVRQGDRDRRQRLLSLTERGLEIEQDLTGRQRRRLANAYRAAGAEAVEGFRRVLANMIDDPALVTEITEGAPDQPILNPQGNRR